MTKKLFTFFMLFVMCLLIPRQAGAVGDLTITPWRIVFGPRDRSASIELLNTSDRAGTYRMGWMVTKATANGKYDQLFYKKEEDKDPHSVPNMVIFSPRQVTIEPHGDQVIRLSLRRPTDLPPGEYRAHVTFIRMADNKPPVLDPNAPKPKTVTMELNVNYGFSIPVIVRQGEDKDLKVSIQSPKLEAVKGRNFLKLDIHRDAGKFSSYGEVDVYWKPPKGEEIKVGFMANIALYPEVQTRTIAVPLLQKLDIVGGTIRIAYIGKLESEGTTWDEKSFPVGGGK